MTENMMRRLIEGAAEIARDLTNYRTLCERLAEATADAVCDDGCEPGPHERLDLVLRELNRARRLNNTGGKIAADLEVARAQVAALAEERERMATKAGEYLERAQIAEAKLDQIRTTAEGSPR